MGVESLGMSPTGFQKIELDPRLSGGSDTDQVVDEFRQRPGMVEVAPRVFDTPLPGVQIDFNVRVEE